MSGLCRPGSVRRKTTKAKDQRTNWMLWARRSWTGSPTAETGEENGFVFLSQFKDWGKGYRLCCLIINKLTPRQPWPTLPGDPLWLHHPRPELPTRCGRWRQRPPLCAHRQVLPAALSTVSQPHALPGIAFRRAKPASGTPQWHRRTLRQGEQVQTATKFAEPATGGEVSVDYITTLCCFFFLSKIT